MSAISEKRFGITVDGKVEYALKTPYRDGTTHVVFEPLDFIAKLVALVPQPRVNLTRFHGVLAPNSQYRARVTPSKRGRRGGCKHKSSSDGATQRESMTWAKRLKRVFNIDITLCQRCSGTVKVIASIEDPVVIKQILDHLSAQARAAVLPQPLPEPRASPQCVLF